jgi:tetratricopeptide (TPR) repeat protein
MHEYKNALTDFDKAIELAAWNADAYYFRGVVKKKLGDIESGNKDISRAIQMNKNIEPQCSQLLPNNF